MSGLGDALTNIGRDLAVRQYDEQREAADERKFLLRESVRQQNKLELKRFQQLIDQEDEERKYAHPDAVAERERDRAKADAELAKIQSQTELNTARAGNASLGKAPVERGGTVWVWDPDTRAYVDTGRPVPQKSSKSKAQEDPMARLRSGLGL